MRISTCGKCGKEISIGDADREAYPGAGFGWVSPNANEAWHLRDWRMGQSDNLWFTCHAGNNHEPVDALTELVKLSGPLNPSSSGEPSLS